MNSISPETIFVKSVILKHLGTSVQQHARVLFLFMLTYMYVFQEPAGADPEGQN